MIKNLFLFFLVFSIKRAVAQQPVLVSDCTVTYTINGSDAATNSNLTGATKLFYVKGKMSRIDIIGQNYKQSVICDNKTGATVVLKEIGAEKYMSKLSADEWKKENKRFEGLTLTLTGETKTIQNYECKKAIGQLKDGSSFSIYYSKNIIPSASENSFQFKDVPGLILEYETSGSNGSSKIIYTATTINLDPVPSSRFVIPVSGFRVLK